VKSPPWVVSSLREVAEFFDLALSTVKGEWRGAGMPGEPGKWNLKEILAWREARRKPARAESGGDNHIAIDGKQLSPAMLGLLEAYERYRRRKMANDKTAGELVSRVDAEQEAAELVVRLRERFEAVPDELQMEFPLRERATWRARLESKVRLILTELSSWGEKTREQPKNDQASNVEASNATKRTGSSNRATKSNSGRRRGERRAIRRADLGGDTDAGVREDSGHGRTA
jgi:hypothetical protein